ncbi:MAG: S1 family peptidase [Kineosporiaceae bacterium]
MGTTDAAGDAAVRAAGARPVRVTRSEGTLDTLKAALDARRTRAAKSITSWYVDVAANTVTLTTTQSSRADAFAFTRAAGLSPAQVKVVTTDAAPRPHYDIRGGDAYYIGGGRCSMGFAVNGGFLTAGHCRVLGGPGALTGSNSVALGSWGAGYSFPGKDYAWITTTSSWNALPEVTGIGPVYGGTEAAVGAAICRSGSTTGVRCGVVQAKNVTVNYAEGTVNGLTQTSACSQKGDSGGSFMAGNQAQGVLSGGSGDCTSGGRSYFQPLNPALAALGLTLRTAPSAGLLHSIAFQANTTNLWTAGRPGTGDRRLGMMAGTSPSVVSLPGGGWQAAFQANTGNLWTTGSLGTRDLGLGMKAGTSPSITTVGSSYQIAFQANTGNLWTTGTLGTRDLGLGMMTGTSPSITAASGGYQAVFQANTGNLWSAGSEGTADLGLGMARGTSPAISN